MKNLVNKLAFVTGGSEGIGLEVCKDLVRAGSNVLVIARDQEKLAQAQKAIDACKKDAQQRVEILSCDVSDEKLFTDKIKQCATDYGLPDYLIHCAGFARPGYLHEVETIDFKKMMDVNYFGIVHSCKALVPLFIEQKKKAHIVNTSSLAGFMGLFGYTGYCASKYAVIGFSQALESELKPYGIKVSVLCPPNTRTPGLDKENKFKPSEVLKIEEKAKVINPEDVSKALMASLDKNKFWIIPTLDGQLALYLSRFAPKLLEQFTKRPSILN